MFLSSLASYLAFMATSLALLAAALAIYMQVTPYRELTLIRAGNRAASFSLGGTVIGLATTLWGVGTSTWRVAELAAWGAIGLACQIGAFLVLSRILGGFRDGIEEDRVGYGVALGCLSIAIGILNAAALGS